ncbi:serine proteinase stubble [Orussus abietinus]|uniref:serine proteinase stubble n=1 Tax=Orussus abietinus TaxID=222816 RepID=UPI000C715B41|nr:serine proteinase stubble [Orussus abietinus]
MAARRGTCLLIAILATTSAFSVSDLSQNRGRKLFGGYRIVPKVCHSTSPSRTSNEPAICMFNYECTRRKGVVIGTCMDGFLFGACCQLPGVKETSEDAPSTENLLLISEDIDHVPDVPILLNPDGTPAEIQGSSPSGTYQLIHTKTSPSTFHYSTDATQNAERPQVPSGQSDLDKLQEGYSALLHQQSIVDDLSLPSLLTHSDSDNGLQDQREPEPDRHRPITTLLSPDQVLQIADPVDQLPALFSNGFGQNDHGTADTVLLNENGTRLDETNDPDQLFKPTTVEVRTSTTPKGPQHHPGAGGSSIKNQENRGTTVSGTSDTHRDSTTPMSSTEGLVRVPTVAHETPSGNKKNDELDREEIAINHIISMLNDTNSETSQMVPDTNSMSSIHTWVSIDETAKPTMVKLTTTHPSESSSGSSSGTFPYSYYRPGQGSSYYNYETVTTPVLMVSPSSGDGPLLFSSSYSSRQPGTQGTLQSSSYSYSTRPTTNPPAPTVIVLGPLGTEYTTETGAKTPTRRPGGPIKVTKRPASVSSTITHNISTVISAGSSSTGDLVSTSYFSVNLKEGESTRPTEDEEDLYTTRFPTTTTKRPIIWTTMSSWSPGRPSFHPKPSTPSEFWTNDGTTSTTTAVSSSATLTTSTLIGKPVVTKGEVSSVSTPKTTTEAPRTTPTPRTTTPSSTPAPRITTPRSSASTTTLSTTSCNNVTAPPSESDFPPDRNPNISQQEKPTLVEGISGPDYPTLDIFSEDDIPTPGFIEDDVLTNKVDVFVNKIVDSLQGNFQDLKDVVYGKRNTTASPAVVTRRPTVAPTTTKRPTVKRPTQGVKKPTTTKRPPGRPVPSKPGTHPTPTSRPQSVISTTKRKPTKRRPLPSTTQKTTTESTQDAFSTPSPAAIEEFLSTTSHTVGDLRNECGIRPLVRAGRIVGGKGAQFGEWPWQVLVREATWLGLFTKNKCGGVLISNRYVITAAHCQPGFLASLVAVFGEFDISGELEAKRSVTRNIRRIIVNRAYDPATFENDLALLELETPIQFDEHIVPICMPNDGEDFTGRMATVTGWGRLKYNGGVPSVLQEVQVPIMENSVCQEMFQTAGHSKKILDSFLCAGYANGQKDSCEGDSGGPLVMERPDGRWMLVGTVSHGIKCAAPYLPGVYMRTTYFKPWLHSFAGV